MTYKKYPFGNHSNDIMEIYHDIMYSSGFDFPNKIINLNILIYLLMDCCVKK